MGHSRCPPLDSRTLPTDPTFLIFGGTGFIQTPQLDYVVCTFQLCQYITNDQIDFAIETVVNAVKRLRAISSSYAYTPKNHESQL